MSLCDTCYWDVNGCVGHSCRECDHLHEDGFCLCNASDAYGPECPYYEYDERMDNNDESI